MKEFYVKYAKDYQQVIRITIQRVKLLFAEDRSYKNVFEFSINKLTCVPVLSCGLRLTFITSSITSHKIKSTASEDIFMDQKHEKRSV